MMDKPRVSFIVPTRNRALYLTKAIRSVLQQTFQDFEVFVIDDASSDQTEGVVKSFSDKRIAYLRNNSSLGAAAARNRGLYLARGEFINCLDDDDVLYPEKITRQISLFEKSDKKLGVVYCAFDFVQDDEIIKTVHPFFRGDLSSVIFRQNILGHSTALVRREAYEKVGYFDESVISTDDWELWMRIVQHYTFDFLPESLTAISVHGQQLSTDINKKINGIRRIIDKHQATFKTKPQALSHLFKRLGFLYLYDGKWREGVKFFARALKLDPGYWKNYFLFPLLLIPAKGIRKGLGQYAGLIDCFKDFIYF